jgi:hypothetical protein
VVEENMSYHWGTFVVFKLMVIYVVIMEWTTWESRFNSKQKKRFLSSPKHSDWLKGPSSFIYDGYCDH